MVKTVVNIFNMFMNNFINQEQRNIIRQHNMYLEQTEEDLFYFIFVAKMCILVCKVFMELFDINITYLTSIILILHILQV